jgi:hypothetical protein
MVEDDHHESVLAGGSVNRVVRVGNTVRRPTGVWTSSVHALLHHLERVRFYGAPRAIGIDDQGREVLTFLNGVAATRPWPRVLRTDAGLNSIAALLRAYHQAVASFVPPDGAQWRAGRIDFHAGQVVSHGDLGPWNSIWNDETLVGLIDWEFAEPRWPIEDVAELAWYFVPLQGPRVWREAGFTQTPQFGRRLSRLCEAYGEFTVEEVVDALLQRQRLERERTVELGGSGVSPWARFLARGDVAQFDEEHAWLRGQRDRLIAGRTSS